MIEAEVSWVAVLSEEAGMFKHEVMASDRLAIGTELKLDVPWVGFTYEELVDMGQHIDIDAIKFIEQILKERNGYERKTTQAI